MMSTEEKKEAVPLCGFTRDKKSRKLLQACNQLVAAV